VRGLEGMGILRCWFDQVDVRDPELTAACSYDICLCICGIDVKVHFVSELRVKFIQFQVLSVTSLAKPCRFRLLMALSGGGIVRLLSSLRASKSRMCFRNVGHLFLVSSGSQVGFHVTLISYLSEDL